MPAGALVENGGQGDAPDVHHVDVPAVQDPRPITRPDAHVGQCAGSDHPPSLGVQHQRQQADHAPLAVLDADQPRFVAWLVEVRPGLADEVRGHEHAGSVGLVNDTLPAGLECIESGHPAVQPRTQAGWWTLENLNHVDGLGNGLALTGVELAPPVSGQGDPVVVWGDGQGPCGRSGLEGVPRDLLSRAGREDSGSGGSDRAHRIEVPGA